MGGQPEFVGGGESRVTRIPPLRFRGRFAAAGVFLVAVLAVIFWAYFTFLEYVRPNEFGIKEVQIGVNRGIQKEVYGPGLWFVMPFGFQRMHRLPGNIQVLEFSMHTGKEKDTASIRHDESAKIYTSDGFYVDVDATILYRITDPYLVMTKLGPGENFLNQGIIPKADPILKQTLGQLTVEEFYVSPMRVKKTKLAKDMMNAELNDKGITVEQVLVRYFKYTDAIQQNIEDKKLQDQLVFTNKSKGHAAQEKQNLERVMAQGEYSVKIALEEGMAFKAKREAERDLYVRSKEAEADLLIKLAESKRAELRNKAMQTAGSDTMVALKMADVLKGLDTILLPSGGAGGMNPLSLDTVVKMFDVKSDGAGRVAMPTRAPQPVTEASPATMEAQP